MVIKSQSYWTMRYYYFWHNPSFSIFKPNLLEANLQRKQINLYGFWLWMSKISEFSLQFCATNFFHASVVISSAMDLLWEFFIKFRWNDKILATIIKMHEISLRILHTSYSSLGGWNTLECSYPHQFHEKKIARAPIFPENFLKTP